ncbi:cardiolipin synthase [Massilia soli]|uniref:Cardiolipin synthase n=1 Tax=Massilia soli TaxID=2792854 RepID=A0ABS7SMF1_9BURK|nr:cardiolipin synthase [Massilia soli]MBZ2207005.1 cardiolipin synthase [Massilia soli]
MNVARWLATSLAALVLGGSMAACASLPDSSEFNQTPVAKANPTVATPKGRLQGKQAAALLKRRWATAAPDLKELAVLEEAATGVPLIAGNKVTLLFDGPATMRAMMEAAKGARNTINLETYIFDQDEIGLQFADILIEKQKQGVTVNVLYDSVGTIGTPKEFFDRMRAAGISLIAFNPVNPAKRLGKWELNNRDHRKVMIVDGRVAFTGGLNISSTYANSSFFRSRRPPEKVAAEDVGWRDTHIKIEGPAVASLQYHFINAWIQQEAGELPPREYFPKLAPAGDKVVRVLASEPGRDSEIYKSYVVAIQEAKKSIHITSAYFVPDPQIVEELSAAARRGVDVKLILPGVTDHGLVFHAGRAFYDELLKNGVKIYELQIAVLHAKAAVIDGSWSTVGSANIDRRSFLHNYELNVVILDPAFGMEMESAFNEDLRDSKQVTLEQWRQRPWADRLKEFAARLTEYWI